MNFICFWNRTKNDKNNLYKQSKNKYKCTVCNCKPKILKIAIIWKQEYIFCSHNCWSKWANSFN